jgi:uncharacterized protein
MRLYSGTTKSLIEDSTYNRIATKLRDAFFLEFRHQPAVAEVNSWNNSLRAVSQVFQTASLLDHGVLLELQLPLTSKRLDCLVTGYNRKKAPNAVIIELKQWSGCKGASGKNEVATFVGGNIRDVLHPSVQVGQYMTYLTDCHTAFQGEGGISAHACSYLHNYSPIKDDPLFGSEREFGEARILGGFLKNDEFGLGDCHALGLEQQVAEVLVAAAPSK